MKKALIILLIFVKFAFGYNYNDVLLKAQASIFPKIILLDKKVKNKLIDGKIVYTIVYDKNDYDTALQVSRFINENYKGYFGEYKYKINLVDFLNFSKSTKASAIYVLNLEERTKEIAQSAKTRGVVSFSYDINSLKNGLMFSLVIEKSTVLYLEKGNLFNQKIEFVDSLLQIVRFTDQNNINNKMLFHRQESHTMYARTITEIFVDMFYN